MKSQQPDSRNSTSRLLRFNRASIFLLSAFLTTIALIIYIWWPLAEEILSYIDWSGPWWLYFDWLLVGIFLYMSVLIVLGADLRRDLLTIAVGAAGGLVIESWGTQTSIWSYYTAERPPLWIIPAWPIASLAIDRMVRLFDCLLPYKSGKVIRVLYWFSFSAFLLIMLQFVYPTMDKSFTWIATILCVGLVLTPTDHRKALLIFMAGAALGYFLELWGTTRQCWTYYTHETPPVFAVLAHGMASVSFWRSSLYIDRVWKRIVVKKHHSEKVLPNI